MTLMATVTKEQITDNLRRIHERIRQSLERAGRPGDEVAVLAVTKGCGLETVDAAFGAGLRLFGENRVQEAHAKYAGPALPGELHLIGHLQTNKAGKAAALFDCVQSIDKLETAAALDRHLAGLGKKKRVLLQLNTSRETSKSGYADRDALLADLDKIRALAALEVAGLMTIGPLSDSQTDIRASFCRLKKLFDELAAAHAFAAPAILSMGMSGDFEAAVEEGATLVRIVTALFGERIY